MGLSPRQVAMGVGLYVASAVGGYLYLRSAKAPAPCACGGRHGSAAGEEQEQQEQQGSEGGGGGATFDRLADQYDSLIAADETFMGLKLMVSRGGPGTPVWVQCRGIDT